MHFDYSKKGFGSQVNVSLNLNIDIDVSINDFRGEVHKEADKENFESGKAEDVSAVVEDLEAEDVSAAAEDLEIESTAENLEPKSVKNFDGGFSSAPTTKDFINNLESEFAEETAEEVVNSPEHKYLPSKLKTLAVCKIYMSLGLEKKAERVYSCGSFLVFESKKKKAADSKKLKLKKINSCKLRLCPYCAWRRSLRTYSNVRACYNYIIQHDSKDNNFKSRFITLVLTTRNCSLSELENEVDSVLKCFSAFIKLKEFKNAFSGFVRSLEVVVDREEYITPGRYFKAKDYYDRRGIKIGDLNENYLKCNVHIHVLLHTTYAKYSENYLERERIIELWKGICNLDYDPDVWIKSFVVPDGMTKEKALAEFAKYTVKFGDYLKADYSDYKDFFDKEFVLDCKVFAALDNALFGRKLLSYGGSFRKAHRILKLNDEDFSDDAGTLEAESIILQYYFDYRKERYKRLL